MSNPTLSNALIQSLLANGHIVKIDEPQRTEQRIEQEQASLQRLRSRAVKGLAEQFLNGYDRLFRHVTLLLLVNGYDLTGYHPHQTLRKICSAWQNDTLINDTLIKTMIHERHTHKKSLTGSAVVNLPAVSTLQQLLKMFDETDSHAITLPKTVSL